MYAQVGPTVIADVTPEMTCYREEIFGPALVCLTAPTLADAVALVNANPYGNGASVFTRSGSAAERFRRTVNVGQVGINVPIPVRSADAPDSSPRPVRVFG